MAILELVGAFCTDNDITLGKWVYHSLWEKLYTFFYIFFKQRNIDSVFTDSPAEQEQQQGQAWHHQNWERPRWDSAEWRRWWSALEVWWPGSLACRWPPGTPAAPGGSAPAGSARGDTTQAYANSLLQVKWLTFNFKRFARLVLSLHAAVCGSVGQTRHGFLARRAYHQCWRVRVQNSHPGCWIFSTIVIMWYRAAGRLSRFFSGYSGLLPSFQVPS